MNCLEEIRRAKNRTLKGLGEAIGASESAVSRYQRDDTRLTLPVMRRLARALDVTVGHIAGDTVGTALCGGTLQNCGYLSEVVETVEDVAAWTIEELVERGLLRHLSPRKTAIIIAYVLQEARRLEDLEVETGVKRITAEVIRFEEYQKRRSRPPDANEKTDPRNTDGHHDIS